MAKSFWLFTISADDKEFARRIKVKKWPIFQYTANRMQVNQKDDVVFYKAGPKAQKLLGRAVIDSKLTPDNEDFYFELKDIILWKKKNSIRPLVEKMDIFEDKKQWGRYLQGGVKRLSKKDFETIADNFA